MKFKSAFFSGHQLHDIDVKIGKSKHKMRMCGHVSGYTRVCGRMAVFCPTPTVGTYVQVQIVKGDSNYLSPAEVIVWGRKVRHFTLVFLFVKKKLHKVEGCLSIVSNCKSEFGCSCV